MNFTVSNFNLVHPLVYEIFRSYFKNNNFCDFSHLILKSFVVPCGAGMESLTWFCSMVILALRELSWNRLVRISMAETTNSGIWTPI